MLELLLTQNSTFIIGPIAKLLGFIMQGIFWLLDKIGIPNIGLAIIIFTIVIYLCLLPLTIKQQKFSKMSAIMNPELTAIQNKYKGKNDQDSMMKMQEETKAVYAKYGVSPSGSCLQLVDSDADSVCTVSCNLCDTRLCSPGKSSLFHFRG